MKTSLILLAFAVIAVAVSVALLPLWPIENGSSAQHEFTINEPMERVRKIMVRSNAAKKIIAMADAELVDQHWSNIDLDAKRPIRDRDWNLAGTGKMVVDIHDDYLGSQEITLNQTVDITSERIESVNLLAEPSESIKEYDSKLLLTPDKDGNAKFNLSLSLTVKTRAGLVTRSIVGKKIQEAAEKSLRSEESAIRDLVSSHQDDLIILPEFGNKKLFNRTEK